jgi:hypothetical protein
VKNLNKGSVDDRKLAGIRAGVGPRDCEIFPAARAVGFLQAGFVLCCAGERTS